MQQHGAPTVTDLPDMNFGPRSTSRHSAEKQPERCSTPSTPPPIPPIHSNAPAKSSSSSSSTAADVAAPKPLLFPVAAAYGILHTCLSIHMLYLWAASLAPPQPAPPHQAAQPRSWVSAGYLSLALFELCTAALTADVLHGVLHKRFTHAQLTDRCLLMLGVVIPMFQLLMTAFHPPFLLTPKNWPGFALFCMGVGAAVFSLSPAQSAVQLLFTSMSFTILDCFARGQDCSTGSWGLPACLITRGLLIVGSGLGAWLTAHILVVKRSSQLRSQAESMAEAQDVAAAAGCRSAAGHSGSLQGPAVAARNSSGNSGSLPGQQPQRHSDSAGSRPAEPEPEPAPPCSSPLPFESLGLRLPAVARRLSLRLEQALGRLAEVVNEEVLVRVVCLPIVFYSLAFCLMARIKFQGLSYCSMSPDTFLIYAMAWFMAGRNSCSFDILPLVQQIKGSIAASFAMASYQPSLSELVDRVRQHVTGPAGSEAAAETGQQITVTELLGEGTFGKVYKGIWRGTLVAVKRMVLPGNVSTSEKRGKMAIMEAAISGALVHPNVVQTYTYTVKSVPGGSTGCSDVHVGDTLPVDNAPSVPWDVDGKAPEPSASSAASTDVLEVQLVMEYMDCGTLRDVLDQGCFMSLPSPSGDPPAVNYYAVLETAADVAKGMMHLHSLNVLHCDLKARNVMLRSCASDPRSFTAKVGDFGLSLKLDAGTSHVDALFQGTATHMAPEVHVQGRQSKAADVYAFGITMWELYTSRRPFQGINRTLLGYQVSDHGSRPSFPHHTPEEYSDLAERCWDHDPDARPGFEEVVDCLVKLLSTDSGAMASVPVPLLGSQLLPPRFTSSTTASAQPLPPAAAAAAASPPSRSPWTLAPGTHAAAPGAAPAGAQPPSSPLHPASPAQQAGEGMHSPDVDWDCTGMSGVLVITEVSESEQRPVRPARLPAASAAIPPVPQPAAHRLRTSMGSWRDGLGFDSGGLPIGGPSSELEAGGMGPGSAKKGGPGVKSVSSVSSVSLLGGVMLLDDASSLY